MSDLFLSEVKLQGLYFAAMIIIFLTCFVYKDKDVVGFCNKRTDMKKNVWNKFVLEEGFP